MNIYPKINDLPMFEECCQDPLSFQYHRRLFTESLLVSNTCMKDDQSERKVRGESLLEVLSMSLHSGLFLVFWCFDDSVFMVNGHRVTGSWMYWGVGGKERKCERIVYVRTCVTNSVHGVFVDLWRCCRWSFCVWALCVGEALSEAVRSLCALDEVSETLWGVFLHFYDLRWSLEVTLQSKHVY